MTSARRPPAAASGPMPGLAQRRPIPSRGARWAAMAAQRLRRAGVRPNQVSLAGLGFAALGAGCLLLAGRSTDGGRAALLVLAAAAIPLRLLCNLLDGMLAVEGGLRTPTGELYNELPDRLADLLLLVAAGYAVREIAWAPPLGWLAGSLALLVAYVRTLGGAAGASAHFEGPMAKPRRMHVLIAGCLVAAVEAVAGRPGGWGLVVALAVVALGSAATIGVRLRKIAADLVDAAA